MSPLEAIGWLLFGVLALAIAVALPVIVWAVISVALDNRRAKRAQR